METCSAVKSLRRLGVLTQLFLNDNQLNGSIPSALKGLSSLTHLGLNDTQLTGKIPSGFSSFSICNLLPGNTELCRADESFTACGGSSISGKFVIS
jgi:hypothetical protein